jgi:hypothetical protein
LLRFEEFNHASSDLNQGDGITTFVCLESIADQNENVEFE